MAGMAPSTTVPGAAAATGASPTDDNVGWLRCVEEFAAGTAFFLKEIPPDVLPVVGTMCKTLLAVRQQVETAKGNKEDFATLRELCEVVKEVLISRINHRGLPSKGFAELQKHVDRMAAVAKLCNKAGIKATLKRFVLARKICKDIAGIRNDVLAFCNVNKLVLANDTNEKVNKLGNDLLDKLEEMKTLTVTQKDFEAMEKELDNEAKAKEALEAELDSCKESSAAELKAALTDLNDTLAAMKTELQNLSAMKSKIEEREGADSMSMAKVPSGAPIIREWHVERKAIVSKACDRLGIGSLSNDSSSEEPRMVGLAGPSGSGKSTVASMVVRRDDVRASFHKGVVWLHVGQGAKDRLAELMNRLAGMVYETVMQNSCTPPRTEGIEQDPEDGVAYIRREVDESSRRFLVVADDVWEVEVLEELKKAVAWVIYTTRDARLLPGAPPLRLDKVSREEAELVLRRAADLSDDALLPEAADDLMTQCENGVMYLAFVGSWSDVRGRDRRKGEAWRAVVSRIVQARREGEGGQLLSWRAAVLRAGLEEIAQKNVKNKELYLSLAVIPKGLAFPLEVAAALTFGHDFSTGNLDAARDIAATLERWSILTLEDGGKYRVHDEHAVFVRGRFAANQDIRDRALDRWQKYMSSVEALLTFSHVWLVKVWEILEEQVGDDGVPSQPYNEALGAMDPSSIDRPAALQAAAHFSYLRDDWLDAYEKNAQLVEIQKLNDGVNPLDVANTLYNFGVCAYTAGETEEAEAYYRRALKIEEKELGVDHPDVAKTLNNLASCAFKAGRMKDAEKSYQRELEIEEKLGLDRVVTTLHDLGGCACNAGRTEEAEKLHQRALKIQQERRGLDHPDVATSLNKLGLCVERAGRAEEAEKYHLRALFIRERELGDDHPDVATTLYKLGVCAYNSGRTKEAEKFFRRALSIREKLDVNHPDVASTQLILGWCLARAGRTEEAEGFHRLALALREEILGVDHADVAEARRALEITTKRTTSTCQIS